MATATTTQTDFDLTDTGGTWHCVLAGRLDTERCERITEPLLSRLQESNQGITFDLAEVSFVASSFLRLCILATRAVGNGNVCLVNTAPTIKKVFKIAGLDGPIRID
ncbi:STAS domain-containing protein [Methylotetracoccus oryzae]|uniref:STAS domain-containing protein n=1 Tax=Methylotetracoccus oryzae TaxID=1919059 RepID=UPI00111B03D7|nr:STAS domain-containing protein [Methylotetracoccus oryzae]